MKGVEGVLVGDVNKKSPKLQKRKQLLRRGRSHAGGWVKVNKKASIRLKKLLKRVKVILEAEGGWVMVNKKAKQQIKVLGRVQVILEAAGWVVSV